MITTITLNPCIDFAVSLEKLHTGALNMVNTSRTDVCGKGINVSIVLKELEVDVQAGGINFTGNGKSLEDKLKNIGIPYRFAVAEGNIRTNIKVLETASGEMTELNSRGEKVSERVLTDYASLLDELARNSEVVVFSGRIPNGAADKIYQSSVELVSQYHCKAIVDAEGAPLRLALEASPYLIKPNTYELEHLFGRRFHSREDVLQACVELIHTGKVRVVCVSMGAQGAMITDGKEAWFSPALPVVPKGLPGAGDSMVAGLCRGVLDGAGIEEMLRNAVAAATASIIREGTLLCQKEDYGKFHKKVILERITP